MTRWSRAPAAVAATAGRTPPVTRSRQVARALRAAVARPGGLAPFAAVVARSRPDGLDGLARAAAYHGVAGYVALAARECAAALGAELGALEAAREQALLGHLRTVADLRRLGQILDAATVPWLAVKGPVLAERMHERPDLRAYSDLDVLVPPSRLGAALDALEAAGSRALDRNWTLIHREMKGEVHARLPAGTVVDLHWHVLNDRPVRDRYAVRTADLFDRSVVVDVAGLAVRTLDPADTIVYLALHAMLSGGHRLIWLKDLEQALDRTGLAPGALVARARSWDAELALTGALQRTSLAVGCPPPYGSLRPAGASARAWWALASAVWRLVPAEREDASGSLGKMVARSVRPTAARSAATLASKLVSRARAGRDGRPDGGRIDPASPGSGWFDSGGPAIRQAYLDAVARNER